MYKNDKYIVVATTKPETLFFDEVIITNSETEKKSVYRPLINRFIPVIYSPKNVSEKGTGYVKITPTINTEIFLCVPNIV